MAFKAAFLGLVLLTTGVASNASAQTLFTNTGDTTATTYVGPGTCAVTSFTASPSSTDNGKSSLLTWTTSGCMHTTLNGGVFTGSQILPMNHSLSTGPLSGTTKFTLSANGQYNSATAYTTVAVADTQYAYSYACSREYGDDPSCASSYQGKFITTAATNVGPETTRLNGIALDTPTTFSAYFEYGTTPNLGYATIFQPLGNVKIFYVNQTIATVPNTRYYYRIVGQILNGPTIRGDVMSFTTPPKDSPYKQYVGDTSGTTTTSSGTTGSTTTSSTTTTASTGGSTVQSSTGGSGTASTIDTVEVKVTTKNDEIRIGDTVEYTVEYKNGTNKTFKDAALTVVFPQGFMIKQSTRGTTAGATVSAPLGTLTPGQSGSIFIEAVVGQNTAVDSTLVTSATLDYALSNGKRDSAVGYVLNHASATNAIAGLALGGGFFPSTVFGWMLTIIIILTIILIARRIAKQKEAGHGHGGGHH